jgi:hypothetical protein
MFREWVLNQKRSRRPKGGQDPVLASLFDYSLMRGLDGCILHEQCGLQSPMHCGWSVSQHTFESLLQLSTSGMLTCDISVAYLSGVSIFSLPTLKQKHLVLALRLTVLFHAMGKLIDPYHFGMAVFSI